LKIFYCLFVIPLWFLFEKANAQTIDVQGQVIDLYSHHPVINAQVVDQNASLRKVVDDNGKFDVTVDRNDSIQVQAVGYASQRFSFKDSLQKNAFNVTIQLDKIQITLPGVQVQGNLDFKDLQQKAKAEEYNRRDYTLHGVNALTSPITALYDEFSKHGKEERGYGQLEDATSRHAVLKALIEHYIEDGILKVKEEDIDLFIDFANVPPQLVYTGNEYDLLNYLKNVQIAFLSWKRSKQQQ
jgi:CarboxypepD_reg-like domain